MSKHPKGKPGVLDQGPEEVHLVTKEAEPWYIAEMCDIDSHGTGAEGYTDRAVRMFLRHKKSSQGQDSSNGRIPAGN